MGYVFQTAKLGNWINCDYFPGKSKEEMITQKSFSKAFDSLVEICEKRSNSDWMKDDDIAFILLGW